MVTFSQLNSDHEESHDVDADDAVLVSYFQTGCAKCFEVLFHRYCRMAFAIVRKVLREQSDVEDVVQEVFLTMYLQRHLYDPGRGSVKRWIGQFAQFKALSRRRRLAIDDRLPVKEAQRFELLASVHRGCAYPERTALLEECLSNLNPRQRRTIEAVHLEGYTLQETAEMLNETLANTRNLYYRGMKSVRLAVQLRSRPKPNVVPRYVLSSGEDS